MGVFNGMSLGVRTVARPYFDDGRAKARRRRFGNVIRFFKRLLRRALRGARRVSSLRRFGSDEAFDASRTEKVKGFDDEKQANETQSPQVFGGVGERDFRSALPAGLHFRL